MAMNRWFSVTPSFRGMLSSLEEEIEKSGKNAAKKLSDSLATGGKNAGNAAAAGVKQGTAEIAAATKRVSDARLRASNAATSLRDAEKRLVEVSKDENAALSTNLKAQADKARYTREAELANKQLERAERDLTSARNGGEQSNKNLSRAEDALQRARNELTTISERVSYQEQRVKEARDAGHTKRLQQAESSLEKSRARLANAGDVVKLKELELSAARDKSSTAADSAAAATKRLQLSGISSGAALDSLKVKTASAGLGFKALAAKALRASAALVGIGGVGSIIHAGWGRLTEIQNATVAMENILGSTDRAQKLIDEIEKSVQGTPFQLQDFVTAGKNLKAFGVAAKDVPQYLRAIGEAAAFGGKGTAGFNTMADAMGKMIVKNKVSMEDLNRITEAGVPTLKILGNHFGVTTTEMTKMISKGMIPAEEAMKALTDGIMKGSEGVAGATEKMAGTMAAMRLATVEGALSGLKSSFVRLAAAGIEPLIPWITSFADKMTDVSNNLKGYITPAVEIAGGVFSGLKTIFGTLFNAATKLFSPLTAVISKIHLSGSGFQHLGESAKKATLFLSPLAVGLGIHFAAAAAKAVLAGGKVVLSFAAQGAAAIKTSMKIAASIATTTAKAAWGAATFVAQGARIIASYVAQGAAAVAAKAKQLGAMVVTGAKMAWLGAQSLIHGARIAAGWALASAPVALVAAGIIALGAVFVTAWTKSETFRTIVTAGFNGLKAAALAFGTVIRTVFLAYIKPVLETVHTLWDLFTGNFLNGIRIIVAGAQKIGAVISDLKDGKISPFAAALKVIGIGIKTTFTGIGESIKNALLAAVAVLKTPIHILGKLLGSIPTKIAGIPVPGAKTLREWSYKLQTFKKGGTVSGRAENGLLYGGEKGKDSIIGIDESGVPTAVVMPGERVMTVEENKRAGALLDAIHSGWDPREMFTRLPGYADGGIITGGGRTNDELKDFLNGQAKDVANRTPLDGTPYHYGGGAPWGDCSYTVGAVAGYMARQPEPNNRRFMTTANADSVLAGFGWHSGKGHAGTLRVGWYGVGTAGHTAGTLPDGTNFEMRGGDGGVVGGDAAGYNLPGATHWAYIEPIQTAPDNDDYAAIEAHPDSYDYDETTSEPEKKSTQQSVSEATGLGESNTWTELGYNFATAALKPAITGQISDALEHFGFSDELPSWMQATKMAVSEYDRKKQEEADEQEKADKKAEKDSKKKPKEPTKSEKLQAIAATTPSYDSTRGADQWRETFGKVLSIQSLSTTPAILDAMVRRSDALTRGNPSFLKNRPPKPSTDPKKAPKPYPAGQDKLIGLFSLTASMARGIPKELGTVYDPAGNAYAAAKYAHSKWGSVETGMNDKRFPFLKDEDIPRYAHGGQVRGKKGKDKNPAYLTAGEWVINPESSKAASTTLDRINKDPASAAQIEQSLRSAAMHAPADLYDSFVPQAAGTMAKNLVSAGFKIGSKGIQTGTNFLSTMAGTIPVAGDAIGAGIGLAGDLANTGLDLVSEPLADIAGSTAEYIAAAPSRAWHAGADTLDAALPTISENFALGTAPLPAINNTTNYTTGITPTGGDTAPGGGVTHVTNNFYGSNDEMYRLYKREEQRRLAGVGSYRGQL